jgi:hypothetical protein
MEAYSNSTNQQKGPYQDYCDELSCIEGTDRAPKNSEFCNQGYENHKRTDHQKNVAGTLAR